MSPIAMAGHADVGSSAPRYQRHRPESTLLYQLVARYYPAFKERMLAEGRALPGYVQREFDDFLKGGRLEHGFLRVRCDTTATLNNWLGSVGRSCASCAFMRPRH